MNTAELRRLAEEAEKTEYARQDASNIDHPNFPGYDEADAAEESSEKLNNYANPSALLELLDRLDAAEKVCVAADRITQYTYRTDIPFYQAKNLSDALAAWQKTKEATP